MAIMKVPSSTGNGTYSVDTALLTCTCPHYLYRLQLTGELCKHIKAVLHSPSSYKRVDKEYEINHEAIQFIITNNDAVVFVDNYGEDVLTMLKKTGNVIEEHGKLKVI